MRRSRSPGPSTWRWSSGSRLTDHRQILRRLLIASLIRALAVDLSIAVHGERIGLFGSASDVWDVQFHRLAARDDAYQVSVAELAPHQIEAMTQLDESGPFDPQG